MLLWFKELVQWVTSLLWYFQVVITWKFLQIPCLSNTFSALFLMSSATSYISILGHILMVSCKRYHFLCKYGVCVLVIIYLWFNVGKFFPDFLIDIWLQFLTLHGLYSLLKNLLICLKLAASGLVHSFCSNFLFTSSHSCLIISLFISYFSHFAISLEIK